MRRDIEKELISWKLQKGRYPLIVRGARQVGKSYLVEAFGKTHFQNNVFVNFCMDMDKIKGNYSHVLAKIQIYLR